MNEPVELLFGIVNKVGPRNHLLGGCAHWCHKANTVRSNGLFMATRSGSASGWQHSVCFRVTFGNLVIVIIAFDIPIFDLLYFPL